MFTDEYMKHCYDKVTRYMTYCQNNKCTQCRTTGHDVVYTADNGTWKLCTKCFLGMDDKDANKYMVSGMRKPGKCDLLLFNLYLAKQSQQNCNN